MTTQSRIERIAEGEAVEPDEDYASKRYEVWLAEGGIVTAEAMDYVVAKRKVDIHKDRGDGQGRVRGSMLGDCVRKQALSYLGIPTTKKVGIRLQTLFVQGHTLHREWQEAGLSAGWLVDIEVPVRQQEWKFEGLMDGVLDDGSIFEYKSIAWTGFDKLVDAGEPKFEHLAQLNGYMHAAGANRGSLVYQNKTTRETLEFRVSPDPQIIDWLAANSAKITNSMYPADLPAPLDDCVMHTGRAWEDCRWASACFPEGKDD